MSGSSSAMTLMRAGRGGPFVCQLCLAPAGPTTAKYNYSAHDKGRHTQVNPHRNCSASQSLLTAVLGSQVSHPAISTTLLYHKTPPTLIKPVFCLQLLVSLNEYLSCMVQEKVFVITHTMHFIYFTRKGSII